MSLDRTYEELKRRRSWGADPDEHVSLDRTYEELKHNHPRKMSIFFIVSLDRTYEELKLVCQVPRWILPPPF